MRVLRSTVCFACAVVAFLSFARSAAAGGLQEMRPPHALHLHRPKAAVSGPASARTTAGGRARAAGTRGFSLRPERYVRSAASSAQPIAARNDLSGEQAAGPAGATDLAPQVQPRETHDACFLPRSSDVTGDIGIHEMAWAGAEADELWVVNTRFSCLCTLDPAYSFVPQWQPPFITALAAEDRCHLNGLAIVDGCPRYVTALGRTDVRNGWRAGKARGGVLMSVPDGMVDFQTAVAALASVGQRRCSATG
jgi:hypothetical protein